MCIQMGSYRGCELPDTLASLQQNNTANNAATESNGATDTLASLQQNNAVTESNGATDTLASLQQNKAADSAVTELN